MSGLTIPVWVLTVRTAGLDLVGVGTHPRKVVGRTRHYLDDEMSSCELRERFGEGWGVDQANG